MITFKHTATARTINKYYSMNNTERPQAYKRVLVKLESCFCVTYETVQIYNAYKEDAEFGASH